MKVNRTLFLKALEIADKAYSVPQFDYEHDSFFIEVNHQKKIIWCGVTGSNDRFDWFDNLLAFVGWFFDVVLAHARWMKRASNFNDFLIGKLNESVADINEYQIIMVGHSYGGAGSQNFTLLCSKVSLCITFNSPLPWKRFKSKGSESLMRVKCHHFVNTADAVTEMPFRHKRFGREYKMRVDIKGNDHGLLLNKKIIDWYFPEGA